MRAVNLIPVEERRNAVGVAGRSNGAAYLLLAVLAVAVLVVGAHALLGARARDRTAEAASLNAAAQQAEARAAARDTAPTTSYATLRAKRVEAVTALVRSRFDWPQAMRQLAQTLPSDVTLTQLTASTASGATSSGGGGSSSLRGALDAPAFELSGCAASQDEVAHTLTDLQGLDGVTRVSLASSAAADGASTSVGAASTSDSTDTAGCGSRPAFSAVVFYADDAAAPASPSTITAP